MSAFFHFPAHPFPFFPGFQNLPTKHSQMVKNQNHQPNYPKNAADQLQQIADSFQIKKTVGPLTAKEQARLAKLQIDINAFEHLRAQLKFHYAQLGKALKAMTLERDQLWNQVGFEPTPKNH